MCNLILSNINKSVIKNGLGYWFKLGDMKKPEGCIIFGPRIAKMTFSEKIDEWIKEAEVRPGSALMILKLVAGRMRDLSERN